MNSPIEETNKKILWACCILTVVFYIIGQLVSRP